MTADSFYMPFECRRNPLYQAVVESNRKWVHFHQYVPLGWTSERYESQKFAEFTALAHPDAKLDELTLLTDWYTWIFYYDDEFVKIKQSGDVQFAESWVRGILTLLGDPQASHNGSPLEISLQELGRRMIAASTPAIRRRFNYALGDAIAEMLWEIRNSARARRQNLLEYTTNRRRSAGALWTIAAVEFALHDPVPDRVFDQPQLRGLMAACADACHIHNDLCSFEREAVEEAGNSNSMTIIMHMLRCGKEQAYHVCNRMRTARVQQMQRCIARLPELEKTCQLSPAELASVMDYGGAMQDWLAADDHWHELSSRYEIGSGSCTREAKPVPDLVQFFEDARVPGRDEAEQDCELIAAMPRELLDTARGLLESDGRDARAFLELLASERRAEMRTYAAGLSRSDLPVAALLGIHGLSGGQDTHEALLF